jgi:nucleoside-diphosphate-sugar epimerase
MANVLVLGAGWVGTAVTNAATAHAEVGSVTTVDPPFDPSLAPRDEGSTAHLRELIAGEGISAVVNACGRVRGGDDALDDANRRFVEWLCSALQGTDARLVHVGSASEYGDPGTPLPIDEATAPRPVGAYAESKAAGSAVVHAAIDGGLDATVARVFNIVDHPIPEVSPIRQWLDDVRALDGVDGAVEVWWPATTRDFVMVEDVAAALVDLAVAAETLPATVNVCTGTGLRFGDIVEALGRALHTEVVVRSLERPGIAAVVGDPTLLRATIGWAPSMSADALAARVVGPETDAGGA